MPGSPVANKSFNDELALLERITTQEAAQEFVDAVSGVKQIPHNIITYNI